MNILWSKMGLSFNGFLKFKFSNDQNLFENFPPKVVWNVMESKIH